MFEDQFSYMRKEKWKIRKAVLQQRKSISLSYWWDSLARQYLVVQLSFGTWPNSNLGFKQVFAWDDWLSAIRPSVSCLLCCHYHSLRTASLVQTPEASSPHHFHFTCIEYSSTTVWTDFAIVKLITINAEQIARFHIRFRVHLVPKKSSSSADKNAKKCQKVYLFVLDYLDLDKAYSIKVYLRGNKD